MKARPRSVEREVADYLSRIYRNNGYSPVNRIPILGRTGPDLEINEANLVIDVKSRIAVPQSHMLKTDEVGYFGEYVGVRLSDLGKILLKPYYPRPSVMVRDWLAHMDEWTREFKPNGLSVIILHKPRMKIANAMFIVKTDDWRNVCKIINKPA